MVQEIGDRSERLRDLNCKFGFLLETNFIVTGEVDPEQLLNQCCHLALAFEGDLDGSNL
jgi:flagellar biosynthesis/type III secretory pathway chaperone